jgi:hypothetical protein
VRRRCWRTPGGALSLQESTIPAAQFSLRRTSMQTVKLDADGEKVQGIPVACYPSAMSSAALAIRIRRIAVGGASDDQRITASASSSNVG